MQGRDRVKVLVVDDSAVVREVLSRELGRHPGIEVVGTAADPFVARDKILRHSPDVMTLDVEMPRMDGITFLRKVMQHHPIPTIVLSSITPKGGKMALEALSLGAFDVLTKPGPAYSVGDMVAVLAEQILAASRTEVARIARAIHPAPSRPAAGKALSCTTNRILAVGASTGGTTAIERFLRPIDAHCPPIAIVQHMPPGFTKAFAERLNSECAMEVREAADGVGMTPRQRLFQVELPLAMPVIMAGVRTAAVWTIGAATLSTPVGQTSLGNYIFSGLQTENWVEVERLTREALDLVRAHDAGIA